MYPLDHLNYDQMDDQPLNQILSSPQVQVDPMTQYMHQMTVEKNNGNKSNSGNFNNDIRIGN